MLLLWDRTSPLPAGTAIRSDTVASSHPILWRIVFFGRSVQEGLVSQLVAIATTFNKRFLEKAVKSLWMRLLILIGVCLLAPYVYWLTNDSVVATKLRFLPFTIGLGPSNVQNAFVRIFEVAGTVLAAALVVLPVTLMTRFRSFLLASALTFAVLLGYHLKFILMSISFGTPSHIWMSVASTIIYFVSCLLGASLVRRKFLRQPRLSGTA